MTPGRSHRSGLRRERSQAVLADALGEGKAR